MTQAQKIAKEKFKKAIAYRTKTGVSLKEAFAHIYGKKVGVIKKKAAPKKKAAVKKAAPKKKAAVKKAAPKKKAVVKKAEPKKKAAVKKVAGIKISGTNYNDPKYLFDEILFWQNQLDKLRAEYRSPERKMYKKSIMDDIKLSKKWLENYKKKLRLHLNKVI